MPFEISSDLDKSCFPGKLINNAKKNMTCLGLGELNNANSLSDLPTPTDINSFCVFGIM